MISLRNSVQAFYPIFVFLIAVVTGQPQAMTERAVVVAIPDMISTLDTLTSQRSDAAAERIRPLLFNSLVNRSKNLDTTGELAKKIQISKDDKAITFILRDDVRFHNGRPLTSADVKYTFDQLFESRGYKSFAFSEPSGRSASRTNRYYIKAIETPDTRTVIFRLDRAEVRERFLSSLGAVPIISSMSSRADNVPVGTGPFRFVNFDANQGVVDLEANVDYWEGCPQVGRLRIRTSLSETELQKELSSGTVDVALIATRFLQPESITTFQAMPELKWNVVEGMNIQYLGLNTTSAPLNNVKVRQAIAYAINREEIIHEVLQDRAKIAYSVLPKSSWAFAMGSRYDFNPKKAKDLIRESGYRNRPIVLKVPSHNKLFAQYALAIQRCLIDVGLNVEVEPTEPNTLRSQLMQGDFQMSLGTWIGGNRDPIFLKDLFGTANIPQIGVPCCNRSRYSNPRLDRILAQAINEADRNKAKQIYGLAWRIISADLPLVPLWYPAELVISKRSVGEVGADYDGTLRFVKDLTIRK